MPGPEADERTPDGARAEARPHGQVSQTCVERQRPEIVAVIEDREEDLMLRLPRHSSPEMGLGRLPDLGKMDIGLRAVSDGRLLRDVLDSFAPGARGTSYESVFGGRGAEPLRPAPVPGVDRVGEHFLREPIRVDGDRGEGLRIISERERCGRPFSRLRERQEPQGCRGRRGPRLGRSIRAPTGPHRVVVSQFGRLSGGPWRSGRQQGTI